MGSTQAEYAHWQQKNAAAIDRITALEMQISKLRQQQQEQQQQQYAMSKLKKNIENYSLRQQEYKLLFQSLGGRPKRATRDIGHSETSLQTAPETKASIAVNQLRDQIKTVLEHNIRNQSCDEKVTSIYEPILALLRSTTVEPQMILDQMCNHLVKFQDRVNAINDDREGDVGQSLEYARITNEQLSLCEQREADSREKNQHLRALKYRADELVRQIKTKVAANYPDEEIQRMLLKYILSKAQKDRYKLKLERLQDAISKIEGDLGSEYIGLVAENIEDNQHIEQEELINKLSIHIDDLTLNIVQQLEQNKRLGVEDEKRLWKEIEHERLQIQSIFENQVDILSSNHMNPGTNSRPMLENELLKLCDQLRLSPNTDKRYILQRVKQLKTQANVSFENEAICNEQQAKSKIQLELLAQVLAQYTPEEEMVDEKHLSHLATKYTEYIKQQQNEFWKAHSERLLSITNDSKQRAIDILKQIQICINERNEMLQGELMQNSSEQDAHDK